MSEYTENKRQCPANSVRRYNDGSFSDSLRTLRSIVEKDPITFNMTIYLLEKSSANLRPRND